MIPTGTSGRARHASSDVMRCSRSQRVWDFAGKFIRSPAFLDHADDLLRPMSKYRGDITRYGQAILASADVMAESAAEHAVYTRLRTVLSGKVALTLLLRLYDQAYGMRNQELHDQCLDRLDAMLKNRVGAPGDYLRLLDD